ncbi:MAG: hypothetical protein JWN85_5176 [Gammaproteobacteria bacterium]|nr:hypothetical protein [Gammaproteobacteria bacterium]
MINAASTGVARHRQPAVSKLEMMEQVNPSDV